MTRQEVRCRLSSVEEHEPSPERARRKAVPEIDPEDPNIMAPKEVVKGLEAGTVDPMKLRPATRRTVVGWAMSRGYSLNRLVVLLRRSFTSVKRYAKAVQLQGAAEMGSVLNVKAVGFGYASRFLANYEEAMDGYREAMAKGERGEARAFLAEARAQLKEGLVVLQSLGLVYKEPDRLLVENMARARFVEKLEAVAAIILDVTPEPERVEAIRERLRPLLTGS